MAVPTVLIFALVVAGVAVTLWGLVSPQRSPLVAIVAFVVALLAVVGAWYALVETESVRWAVGYGVAAVVALGSAGRQFAGGQPVTE